MAFSTRNSYYLRISRDTVLVLYLYLDQAHVRWMTDFILQKVLNDLRTRIGPKLEAEAGMTANVGSTSGQSGKKGGPTIDVHQGDDYQFCYFLRKTDHRHVVLVKNKRFVSRPIPPAPDFDGTFDDAADATPAPRGSRSRSRSTAKGKGKGKGREGSTTAKKRRRVVDSEEVDQDGRERSVRSETRDYEDEEGSERSDSVGPSRLRGGAGEGDEGVVRMDDREGSTMDDHEDVDAAPSPPPINSVPTVKPDPDDPSAPSLSTLLAGPTSPTYSDDDDQVPLVAMTDEDFPPPAEEAPLFMAEDEDEDRKPFDLGAGGGLGGGFGGDIDEDEKLFKPALELTYLGFSIYEKHLCLVIEPWPALPSLPKNRPNSRTPSSTPFGSHFSDRPPAQSRSGSVASSSGSFTPVPSSRRGASQSATPGPSSSASSLRTGTPLFRPQTPMDGEEDDEAEGDEWEAWRGRSVSVLPGRGESPARETSVGGDGEGDGIGKGGGMMQFSQVMMTSGGSGRDGVRVGEGEEGEEGGDGDGGDDGDGGGGGEA